MIVHVLNRPQQLNKQVVTGILRTESRSGQEENQSFDRNGKLLGNSELRNGQENQMDTSWFDYWTSKGGVDKNGIYRISRSYSPFKVSLS